MTKAQALTEIFGKDLAKKIWDRSYDVEMSSHIGKPFINLMSMDIVLQDEWDDYDFTISMRDNLIEKLTFEQFSLFEEEFVNNI